MEPTTKIICAICALIVVATITIHANSGAPPQPVLADEQTTVEDQVRDAPLSGGFSYSYDQRLPSRENGARYQQFGNEDLVGSPEEELPLEDDPLLYEDDSPIYIYPPAEARTDATVYASDDDPAMEVFDMTDQQVLDTALGMMDPDQRASFRATWLTLTPEERQQVILQMRMGMTGS